MYTSILKPFDIEVIITPNANAAVDTRAIVTSPDAPFFWLINSIMNDYVFINNQSNEEEIKRFDISKIDFDLLQKEFAKSTKRNLIFKDLDELVQERLDCMLKENPKRIDYYERYCQIIEDYNSEKDRVNIEN